MDFKAEIWKKKQSFTYNISYLNLSAHYYYTEKYILRNNAWILNTIT